MTKLNFSLSPANQKKIQNLLSEAILTGDVPRAHKLLAQGADPSGRGGPLGYTPLMDAASVFNRSLIEFFLPLNDVNATSKSGSTALSLFINYLSSDVFCGPMPNVAVNVPCGWQSSLGLLLSAGATGAGAGGFDSIVAATAGSWSSTSIDLPEIIQALPPSDFSAPDAYGCSAYINALASPCSKGGLRAAALLKIDPMRSSALLSWSPQHGTLAHVAARHRRIDFLLEIATEADLEARDSQGRTPLMAAMIPAISPTPSFPCVQFLLRRVDPQAIDLHGCDALMLLIEENRYPDTPKDPEFKKIIAWLVPKSNLWARDFLGESALDKARDRNMHGLARLILRTRHALMPSAPTPASCPSPPWSPEHVDRLQELLFRAIERNQITLVKKLLAQGACPRRRLPPAPHRIYDGKTPLITAAACHGDKDVAAVIRYLAPLSNVLEVDVEGRTALFKFLQNKHISRGEDLLALRALFSPEVARIASHKGQTPLMVATANQNFWPAVIDILSEASDWMAIDDEGNNILTSKLLRHSTPADRLAIWNAHPNPTWLAASANHAGETIAHLAAFSGHTLFLKEIASQVDFSARTSSGMTPLLRSSLVNDSFFGSSSVTARALAPWSDCRAVDLNGCDALMLVAENASLENDNILHLVEALAGRVDLDARDFLGESALDKALRRGLAGTVAIIRSRMAIILEKDALASIVGLKPQPSQSSGRRI